jgi:hypothetical protein
MTELKPYLNDFEELFFESLREILEEEKMAEKG